MYKTAKKSEEKTEDGDDIPFISQPVENEENPLNDRRFMEMTNVLLHFTLHK